jgi:hypothetical protein
MLITLLFICLSGMTYGHYGMILIPLVSYPLGLLFSEIEKIEIQNIAQIILTILSIYFISTHIMPNWINLIKTLPSSYVNRTKTHREGTVNEIANIIKTHTSENDTISVYGNWDTVYITSERPHATRYSYQSPIGVVMPKIMNEYLTQLQAELPKIIVVQAGRKDDTISNFLENNKYELIWSQNGESLDGALIYYKEF